MRWGPSVSPVGGCRAVPYGGPLCGHLISSKYARGKISARLAALDTRDGTLQPPSSARIEKVMKLSNELDAEIRNAQAGSSVLAIATKAVELAAEASAVGTV